MKLRMRVKTDYVENDPPGSPRRKTIGLGLVPSDGRDDNHEVAATSGGLELHGCHGPGWLPFAEGGDFYVTVERAPPLATPRAEPEPAEKPGEPPVA